MPEVDLRNCRTDLTVHIIVFLTLMLVIGGAGFFLFGFNLLLLLSFCFLLGFVVLHLFSWKKAVKLTETIEIGRNQIDRLFSNEKMREFTKELQDFHTLIINEEEVSQNSLFNTIEEVIEEPMGRYAVFPFFSYIISRYIIGETISVDLLKRELDSRNESEVECFQKGETYFMLGFIGTILGIVMHVVCTQNKGFVGILDNQFLSGAIMASTTTLMGILTALAAGHLSKITWDQLSHLSDVIIREGVYKLIPMIGATPEQRQTILLIDQFDKLGNKMGNEIEKMADKFTSEVPNKIAKAIETSIHDRLTDEMNDFGKSIRQSIEYIGQSMKESSESLDDGMQALCYLTQRAIDNPGAVSTELHEAADRVSEMGESFKKVCTQIKHIFDKIKETSELLEEKSIGFGNVNPASVSLIPQIEKSLLNSFQENQKLCTGLSKTSEQMGRFIENLLISIIDKDRQKAKEYFRDLRVEIDKMKEKNNEMKNVHEKLIEKTTSYSSSLEQKIAEVKKEIQTLHEAVMPQSRPYPSNPHLSEEKPRKTSWWKIF